MISATHLGCSAARNKGDAVCANKRTDLESQVLHVLRTQLMSPDVYASFVRSFTAEWNREQGARDAEQAGQRAELARVAKKVGNFVNAIAENGTSAALQAALKEQEARQREIEAALAVAEVPAPRLMPNLAEVYRAEVTRLQEELDGDDAAAVRERVRKLIEEIRLVPSPTDPKAPLQIEVRGALAAMLALGTIEPGKRNATNSGELAAQSVVRGGLCHAACVMVKLVAGAGFEPAAFRL